MVMIKGRRRTSAEKAADDAMRERYKERSAGCKEIMFPLHSTERQERKRILCRRFRSVLVLLQGYRLGIASNYFVIQ